jgi:hypothetical protein
VDLSNLEAVEDIALLRELSTAGDGRCCIRAKSPSTPPSARSASVVSTKQISMNSCRGAGPEQNRRTAWRSASRSCPTSGGSAAASDWRDARLITGPVTNSGEARLIY